MLEEAIEEMKLRQPVLVAHPKLGKYSKAHQLGIEALERTKTVREDWHRPHPQPVIDVIEEAVAKLPSETEHTAKQPDKI